MEDSPPEPVTAKASTAKPSVAGLARQLGLSVGTVSRALNDDPNVRSRTRARVLKAAAEAGYVPNAHARALRRQKTHRLGLLLPSLTNPFYVEKVSAAQQAAWSKGYDIAFACAEWDPEQEAKLLLHLISLGVDGLILASPGEQFENHHPMTLAQNRNIPVLMMLDSTRGVGADHAVSILSVDKIVGARLAMRHLLDLGHRRIGLVGIHRVSTPGVSVGARMEGIEQALAQAGQTLSCCEFIPADFGTSESGYAAICRRLTAAAPMPTALIAVDDQVAIGAVAALKDHGRQVPDDISVVGFDNTTNAQFCRPCLTTVSQTHLQLGRRAVEIILEQIEQPDQKPQHVTLEPRLVVGQSTAPPPTPRLDGAA